MKPLLYAVVVLGMSVSCNDSEVFRLDPNAATKFNCNDRKITQEFKNVEAKVINPNYIGRSEKDPNLIYFFT